MKIFCLPGCVTVSESPKKSTCTCSRMLLVLHISVALASTTRWHQLSEYTFKDYVAEFQKVYATVEEAAQREKSFNARLAAIKKHNADPRMTYKRGVNHLTDRMQEELKPLHGLDRALLFSEREATSTSKPPAQIMASEHPPGIDWRRRGALTPVKNQGQCGSCWTFASAETLESRWFLKTGELQELSEQFILDCTENPHACGGTGGCGGGTAKLAYDRLSALGGIPSEWTYPYLSGDGSAATCHGLPLSSSLEKMHGGQVAKAANVTGHVSLPTNSYEAMMFAVVQGPLAVSVDAGAWHDYESGVFNGGNHTNPTLDHLVQLVGYGTDPITGMDYWIIRNSWTPLWGEEGFMRLLRSSNATCGLDMKPGDGDGCTGGPKQVKVCGQSGILYDGVYPLV